MARIALLSTSDTDLLSARASGCEFAWANPARTPIGPAVEGADIVMVKPAMSYLDVVRAAADVSPVPVAAYQVSGEYSMITAAADNGWIDRRTVVLESLTGIRRAGADIVLTYWAADVARWLS